IEAPTDESRRISIVSLPRRSLCLATTSSDNQVASGEAVAAAAIEQSFFEKEGEDRERQARDLKAGLHPLKHRFVFWYTRRTPGVRT
ncbi:hypothetical protein Dimus_025330, partial [Dionaea muscipula]